jgi:hypothetical protein
MFLQEARKHKFKGSTRFSVAYIISLSGVYAEIAAKQRSFQGDQRNVEIRGD